MDTIEYRTIDKQAWPRGAWDDEPDKVQWPDKATSLPCLIVRGPLGNLCGYVGVPPGHPWHGADCSGLEPYPEVHGGLTYADACRPREGEGGGICYVPDGGEPDDVWWLGFDCAHLYDFVPGMPTPVTRLTRGDTYRDRAYVESECASLAAQAQAVAS